MDAPAPLKLNRRVLRPLTRAEAEQREGATAVGCQTVMITFTVSYVFCTQPPSECSSSTTDYSCGKIGSCCDEETL